METTTAKIHEITTAVRSQSLTAVWVCVCVSDYQHTHNVELQLTGCYQQPSTCTVSK